jgi:outer membrane protein insertion porin family
MGTGMRAGLILLLGWVLCAQTADKYPLEALRIQGNKQIPAEKIIAASGLKIGTRVQGKPEFDAARDRLLETGAFESVGYSFKPSLNGYDTTFEVVEVGTLYTYRFEALPATDDALRAALRKQEPLLGDNIPATPQVLNRYNAAIRQFFESKVEATSELNADTGHMEILFRPAGEVARIAEVKFTGNREMLTALLLQKLSKDAVGIPFSEPLLRRVLDSTIRPMYEEQGRIRVAFPEITGKKAETNDGVVVTIAINEGPVYKLGTVALAGVPSAEVAQLEKSDDWHKGDAANFTKIEASLEKIRQRQRAQGYLRASTSVVREIHDDDQTVNLTVNIDRGPQFTLGKLDIQGLDLIGEPAVRKMWKIEPGQPFQDGYPESFLNRVREEGIFDNLGKTRAETNIDEATHNVDVTLFFSGARTPAQGKDGKRR